MTLGQYLADAGRRPWVDGLHDCCTFPADWVMLRGHPDPMAPWRGRYGTAEEARSLIEASGGLEPMWAAGLEAAGVPEAEALEEGDVGIVRVVGEQGEARNGAIFTGRRWAFLAPRGLFVSSIDPAFVVRAWRP